MTVAVRSFAKINLGLYIGAARADGFHGLRTVYQTIALHDVIRVSVGRGRGIEVLCKDPRVPLDASNTCWRMAERVMDELGASGRVTIEIEKRLPVQGGMGAASSNAVATLIALERALKRFNNGREPQSAVPQRLKPRSKENSYRSAEALRHPKALSASARLRIAAEVGSDLPLFLVGGTVLGVGRGEEVYPLADLPSAAMVVVTPEVGVSTPRAFADWDELLQQERAAELRSAWTLRLRSGQAGEGARPHTNSGAEPRRHTSIRTPQLTRGAGSDRLFEVGCALSAWLTGLGLPNTGASARGGSRVEKLLLDLVRTGIENDFEKVVFPKYPELRDTKGELERTGSRYASLSGSGSTLYGVFRSPAEAVKAASRLRKRGLKAVATRMLTRQQYWRAVVGR